MEIKFNSITNCWNTLQDKVGTSSPPLILICKRITYFCDFFSPKYKFYQPNKEIWKTQMST